MDDSALYTGVDGDIADGIFGNETESEVVKKLKEEQKAQLESLRPKLQNILDAVDKEIASVMSIDRFTKATIQPEQDIRAEIQAAALYKQYLDNFKTLITLSLQETKKK